MSLNSQYHYIYHKSRINDFAHVFSVCKELAAELGSPFGAKQKGKPYKFPPTEYAAISMLMVYTRSTYRDIDALAKPLFSNNLDHSTIGKILKKIPIGYIQRAIALLYAKVKGRLKGAFIADSTGFTTNKLIPVERPNSNRNKQKEALKLHIVAEYFPRKALIPIARALITGIYAHDSPPFRKMLADLYAQQQPLYADSAYDARINRQLCEQHGFKAGIKQRKLKLTRQQTLQRKPYKHWNKQAYKQTRGLIETIFGGLQHRYNNTTKKRLSHTRQVHILLHAVCHNIKTYLRLLAEVRPT